jgi:hypothetical protein
MSVKLSRVIFRRIGGRIVPIRSGVEKLAIRQVRVLPPLAPAQKIREFFSVKQGLKNADFYLQRKGSESSLGAIRKGFESEDIGVKVIDRQKIVPDFAKYAFMNLKNQGFFRNLSKGSLNLKNIRVSDIAESSVEELFPTMKDYRKAYSKMEFGTQISASASTARKANALIKKGWRLKPVSDGAYTLRSPAERIAEAESKGIRFIKQNGHLKIVRPKK